jgi:hypothetical protein
MGQYPNMAALVGRVTERPAAARAIAEEGLKLDEFAIERAA